MADFEKAFLAVAKAQEGAYAKALADYLFREIIEDAHEKYKISQADMEEMCRMAVNRAALFLDIQTRPKLYDAFALYAIYGLEWDAPAATEDTEKTLNALLEIAGE
jgi:hypothetical protein